ncbi:hypothetical protein [Streptomyces niveus]|uniref:hypothetical protein n=1 Tax=Streptomyces niveus TaxID=193462 RepID=UPI00341BFF92
MKNRTELDQALAADLAEIYANQHVRGLNIGGRTLRPEDRPRAGVIEDIEREDDRRGYEPEPEGIFRAIKPGARVIRRAVTSHLLVVAVFAGVFATLRLTRPGPVLAHRWQCCECGSDFESDTGSQTCPDCS